MKKHMKILFVVSIAINIIGIIIARLTGLPLRLDSAGTILASVYGGYMPGVAVSFITGLLIGITDRHQVYFIAINMILAVFTAFFSVRGLFKKTSGAYAFLLIIAPITGICGAVISTFLNDGGVIGANYQLFLYLYERIHNVVAAQLISGIACEFVDKAIMITIFLIISRVMSAEPYRDFRSGGIWQTPLDNAMWKAVRESKIRVVSLRIKIMFILVIGTILIAFIATVISLALFKKTTIQDNERSASSIASVAAEMVDGDMTDEYIEKGFDAEGYAQTRQMLYKLRESTPDVKYVYVYKIEEDGCHVVFDLDTDDTPGSEPGELIEFDQSFYPYLDSLLAGKEIEPIISNDKYGWLLTVYKPVYDSNGDCRCYAAVDVSMYLLSQYNREFLGKLIAILLGFVILIVTFSVWFIKNNVILPVNTMAFCTKSFAYGEESAVMKNLSRIDHLQIRTGDEIENLYFALMQTAKNSVNYMADIKNKTQTISKMQSGLIIVLADMVESRDENTGDHVRKTAAYVQIILEELQKEGPYSDRITDSFIEDAVNAAPLHDIGKIHISDMILNKPGKLTDEEFEIMKKHTVYGSEIIQKVMQTVPEAGYLKEAKNIAEFHHEKWNGAGYPCGLSGEDIPLSARVMAVADVFDALVSKRCYKGPYPFDEAISIIAESSGTHFDPVVAEAFLSVKDKVYEISQKFSSMSS